MLLFVLSLVVSVTCLLLSSFLLARPSFCGRVGPCGDRASGLRTAHVDYFEPAMLKHLLLRFTVMRHRPLPDVASGTVVHDYDRIAGHELVTLRWPSSECFRSTLDEGSSFKLLASGAP